MRPSRTLGLVGTSPTLALALALAVPAVLGAFPVAARAEVGDAGALHPDLVKAEAIARASLNRPEAYAALREIWRTWDRADPGQVEEAIVSLAQASSASPPVRVYAELLEAFARRRRGDLTGAEARVKTLGFVDRWLTVGPFDNENKAGFVQAFGPETELADLRAPIDFARSYDGKDRPIHWRAPPLAAPYGWVDLGEVLRPAQGVCGYATTWVSAKAGTRAPRNVSLWLGSSGASRVYWNGEVVLEDPGYRELDIDRIAAMVTLQPGPNRITVKVCGADEAARFALRIGDERGAPDRGIDVSVEVSNAEATGLKASKPGASSSAKPAKDRGAKGDRPGTPPAPARTTDIAKLTRLVKPDGPPAATLPASASAGLIPAKSRIEGPLQVFERLTSTAKPAPAVLEAYARYLATTGGDTKPEHRARDLARRAAEAEPTVKRLLLAGQLAEDRNQQRVWVDKAAALARGPDLDVLLMQAQLARTSTNWRDAVPIFQKLLALDPDHVNGTLGLVELYIEAGLKRSALAALEKAVARQPESVALLRVYAGCLRSLGRDEEAYEIETRYAGLRFDDHEFIHQQIDLAVARHDTPGAERWLGRFVASEPDSTVARILAARTYRALGQRPRAVAEYQRALALAPEDIPSLRALSDLYGEDDKRDEQLKLLRQILALSPQAKEIREYVEHIEPPRPRADEAYAWAPERFLGLRAASGEKYPKRTLRNLTVTTVFPNGLASRFRQVVFQPLTAEAAASAREYAFGYQADKQAIQLRGARVYRADGKVDDAVESGEGSANDPALATYTSSRTFYVHFPRLEAGDIVELRYRVEDVALRNEVADYYGEVEYMSDDEPTLSSELVLITPKTRKFYVNAESVPGVQRETKEEGDQRIERFVAERLPAITAEPVMPPWSEIIPHIHISTFKSWDDVGAFYWGLARDQFDVDDEVRRRVRELTKGLKDDAAKVRAVLRFVTRLQYVALELGIEGIKPRRCAQTIARGWGDCKDKATVIVTMLRELGIPSTIVLVRTGMRGGIEPTPASLAPFDHAIAYVPSLDLYLDGTAAHTGANELPPMDRGAFALQINEGHPKLVHLPDAPPEASLTRRRVELTLAPDGSAQVGVDFTVAGAFASDWRTRYLSEPTRRERAQHDLGSELGALDLAPGKAGLELNDLDDDDQPVHIRAKGRSRGFARNDGETLHIPAGPSRELVREYASLSTRNLDVDLHARSSREDEWTIRLPPGTHVARPPVPAQLDTPFGRFSVAFEETPGKVVVKTSLAFKKARITPAEYPAWRSFCEAADRAFGQTMVVSR